ncbi:MAG: SMI1/KNR4 family protein [Myxococcales bacterium]|nr:SMI1/KNR4 family protein [Myxococcales bacterium]
MALRKRTQSSDRAAGFRWRWPTRRRQRAGLRPGDDLVALIRQRLSSTRLDDPTSRRRAFEPASAQAIAEAEQSLDFALPPVLKQVLLEVGNGGFGPGHGLLGVRGGATDEHGNSMLDLYDGLSATNPDDPGWRWPERLVPLCPWGDSTYSCIDCSVPEGQLVTYDANGYQPGTDLERLFTAQDLAVDAWLRLWTEGVDLWSRMFPLD